MVEQPTFTELLEAVAAISVNLMNRVYSLENQIGIAPDDTLEAQRLAAMDDLAVIAGLCATHSRSIRLFLAMRSKEAFEAYEQENKE